MIVEKFKEGMSSSQKNMLAKQEEQIALLVSEALKQEKTNKKPMEGKANGKSSSRKPSK